MLRTRPRDFRQALWHTCRMNTLPRILLWSSFFACQAGVNGHDAADSTTVFFAGQWHMYAGQEEIQGQLHAVSADGLTFTLADPPILQLPTNGYYATNNVVDGGSLRLFAFNGQDGNIRSFTTTDMQAWTASDVALEATDLATDGTGVLQDSAVVRLAKDRYLMVYVSELPV